MCFRNKGEIKSATNVVNVILNNDKKLWPEKLKDLAYVKEITKNTKQRTASEKANFKSEWLADSPLFICDSHQLGDFTEAYNNFIDKSSKLQPVKGKKPDKAASNAVIEAITCLFESQKDVWTNMADLSAPQKFTFILEGERGSADCLRSLIIECFAKFLAVIKHFLINGSEPNCQHFKNFPQDIECSEQKIISHVLTEEELDTQTIEKLFNKKGQAQKDLELAESLLIRALKKNWKQSKSDIQKHSTDNEGKWDIDDQELCDLESLVLTQLAKTINQYFKKNLKKTASITYLKLVKKSVETFR